MRQPQSKEFSYCFSSSYLLLLESFVFFCSFSFHNFAWVWFSSGSLHARFAFGVSSSFHLLIWLVFGKLLEHDQTTVCKKGKWDSFDTADSYVFYIMIITYYIQRGILRISLRVYASQPFELRRQYWIARHMLKVILEYLNFHELNCGVGTLKKFRFELNSRREKIMNDLGSFELLCCAVWRLLWPWYMSGHASGVCKVCRYVQGKCVTGDLSE